MSELFELKILAVSGATAKVRFEVCHPDQWDVPGSKNVALQTVVETYWSMKMGYLWDEQPLTEDQAKTRVDLHKHRATLEAWLELAHGKKLEITEDEYNRLNDGGGGDETLSGWGMSDGAYHKHYPTAYAQFNAEAEQAIVEVHLEDEEGNPKANEDDADPKGTLVFTVKDASWLSHMEVGTHWGSAMYDFDGYA
jgi:hypothetical protein